MPNAEPNPVRGDTFLTPEELAVAMGVSFRTVQRWRYKMGLPVMKRGNVVLFDVVKVRAWLAASERGGLKEPRRRRA